MIAASRAASVKAGNVAIALPSGFHSLTVLSFPQDNNPTVLGHHHTGRTTAVSIKALELLAAIHLPEFDRTVLAGTDQHIRVGSPGKTSNRSGVPDQVQVQTAGIGFPYVQATAAVSRRDQHAVRAVINAVNPVGVLLEFKALFAGRRVKNANDLLRTSQSDAGEVVVDIGAEDRVEFISDR